MKFWKHRIVREEDDRSLQHEFVIGPLCDNPLFPRPARAYYCIRCRWKFLVCGSSVLMLDERGNPLTRSEISSRFDVFDESLCPVFKALTLQIPGAAATTGWAPGRNENERGNLASGNFRVGTDSSRPCFRLLSRLRENLGRAS